MSTPPTPAETNVLQLLWEKGAATVPELHEEICRVQKVGYTTVQKRLQRMEEKGLVKRAGSEGRAVKYEAVRKPEATRQTLIDRVVSTAFGNSPNQFLHHAIGQLDLTSEDIADIRDLLDRIEKEVE